MKIVLNYKY